MPSYVQAYVTWASSDKGPGKVFALTFLRELRSVEKKNDLQGDLDEGQEAMIWRDIGKIPAFDVSMLDTGDTTLLHW